MAENRHVVKRDSKETGVCVTCETYKHRAIFYDFYIHPAIQHLFKEKDWYKGKICLKCAKRELGNKHYNLL